MTRSEASHEISGPDAEADEGPSQDDMETAAAATAGAVTGAATGALIGGPPGAIAGAAAGTVRGVVAKKVIDHVREGSDDG